MQYTAYNINLAKQILGCVTRTSNKRRQRLSRGNSLAKMHYCYCKKGVSCQGL